MPGFDDIANGDGSREFSIWSIQVGDKSVVLSTLLTFTGPLQQFADPQIPEQQVGR